MFTAAITARVKVADADLGGLSESITWTVNVLVDTAVAIPEMVPVAEASDIPEGNIPFVTVQVNGPTPPVSRIVWL